MKKRTCTGRNVYRALADKYLGTHFHISYLGTHYSLF